MGSIVVLSLMAFFIWVVVQAVSEKAHAKWKRRYEPWEPVVHHVRADARAVFNMVATPFRFRRHRDDFNWDEL